MPDRSKLKEVFPVEILKSGSSTNSYIIILYDPIGKVSIPILIGEHEAQAIIIAKENIEMRRPLTHQLLCNVCKEFSLSVSYIVVNKFEEGVFYTSLYISDGINPPRAIDSRTSDAIAIALSLHVPMYITDDVLAETGISTSDMDASADDSQSIEKHLSVEELEEELQQLLEDEEYEKAAEIQKQIEELKKSGQ